MNPTMAPVFNHRDFWLCDTILSDALSGTRPDSMECGEAETKLRETER